jgi:hypothetical protein
MENQDLFCKDALFEPFSTQKGSSSILERKIRQETEQDGIKASGKNENTIFEKNHLLSSGDQVNIDESSELLKLRTETVQLNEEIARLREQRILIQN